MNILPLLALAATAQPSVLPPPAPPPPAAYASELFERERANLVENLREACMSEEGIAVAVGSWARDRKEGQGRGPIGNALRDEIGRVALTAPIDPDRLQRALEAEDRQQAHWRTAYLKRQMDVLRRLSPEDRVVFARRMTIMSPAVPPRTCRRRD
jgi:hypothetical protein